MVVVMRGKLGRDCHWHFMGVSDIVPKRPVYNGCHFSAFFEPLSSAGVAVLQESPHPAGCGSLTAAPPSLHLQGTLETMAHLQGLSEGFL